MCMSDALGEESTVNDDRLTRRVAGRGADEIDGGARQFIGVAESTERGVALEPAASLGAFDERAVQVRREYAGRDSVHANAERCPLVAEPANQAEHAALAARVCQHF